MTADRLTWVTLMLHAASTWAMVGVIWFVQVVQYPLFAHVAPSCFVSFHAAHMRQTTYVVLPLMCTEAVTAAILASSLWMSGDVKLSGISLALLAAAWGSTFLIQVPLHNRLTAGFDPTSIERLVVTNWIRTVAWSGRGIVAVLMILKAADSIRPGAA